MPHCTSSAIITMPCCVHSSRMRCRKRGGTGMKPASPCTGSMIIAATADGSTCATNACSSWRMPKSTYCSSVIPAGVR